MKKTLLIFSLCLTIISCGKKEPSYLIYTMAQKREIYREAKRNNDEKKLKELKELRDRLELEAKKNNDQVASEEFYQWDAVLKGV
ncbi:hypothetical protein RN96_07090 [Fusobacterium polymorphum]|uniref:Lipoprotein n=1 Tax=Fusobacterium nucleatum subsp. polymorphum TaxID=76857 RepID=A0A2B7YHT9_FUSNP|nr:hypothetical protein [Fusobacterium polymorphum]PGH20855.1 hypothetical protein RN96_07090 [Fusobacterium polymorphum]